MAIVTLPQQLQIPPGKMARMREFTTLESFVEEMNNFHLNFHPRDEIYRKRNYFLRFEILNPDLKSSLMGQLDYCRNKAKLPELFQAYQIMSMLVSIDDRHVIREGKVDDYYLLR